MQLPIHKVSHASPNPERSKVIDFLDHELRHRAGFSVREEFPSVFGEYPGGESLYLERTGRVVSHASILVREFQHPEYRLRIGLIGTVATAVECQGHGLASILVKRALEELKGRGCAVAVLWSDTPEFYAPFGFVRAGRERDLRFSRVSVPSIETVSVPYDASRHGHLVWRTYMKHEARLDRSLEESKSLCRIPNLKLFVTEIAGGGISSYVAIQKGMDFENYVHEWGGDIEAVARNLAWVQRNAFPDKELTLIAPAHRDLGLLPTMAEAEWAGVVGLMKVLDLAAVLGAYVGFLRGRGIEAKWDRAQGHLEIGGKIVKPSSEGEWLQFIFGGEGSPLSATELPFFLWGFDSI